MEPRRIVAIAGLCIVDLSRSTLLEAQLCVIECQFSRCFCALCCGEGFGGVSRILVGSLDRLLQGLLGLLELKFGLFDADLAAPGAIAHGPAIEDGDGQAKKEALIHVGRDLVRKWTGLVFVVDQGAGQDRL